MTMARPRAAMRGLPGVVLALALAVASACAPAPPSSPSGIDGLASGFPSSAGSASPAEPAAGIGQTDTDWGRIWDALPAAFPVYPGAAPAGEIDRGPASATYAIDGATPQAVASWMQTELERTGYTTESLTGPFEDGSFVLALAGPPGCRVEVSVARLGGLTSVTVRYGAACPGP